MLPFLLITLSSRILTGVSYIEDIDSLRFSLSLIEFDVVNLQPHFPVYPIFTALAKTLHSIFVNNLISFSIIGGMATIIISICSLRISKTDLISLKGCFITLVLFFNPLLWLMSTRYMPDLLGVACVMLIITSFKTSLIPKPIGFFLSGCLLGIRLSYLPFIFPIVIFEFVKSREFFRSISLFLIGIFIWLIPLILITGLNDLIIAASKQTIGHFNVFGGTISTDPVFSERIGGLFQAFLADGLGFYWPNRHWLTLITTVTLCLLCITNFSVVLSIFTYMRKNLIFTMGILLYTVWILFFQNIIHKSRHILPLLPFACMAIGLILSNIWMRKNNFNRYFVILFLISYSTVSLHLVYQHKSPTAISQIKDYLNSLENPKIIVTSTPLIKYYLQAHDIQADYMIAKDQNEIDSNYLNFSTKNHTKPISFITIGSRVRTVSPFFNKKFFHNPYVNRLWPILSLNHY